jgi:hypothetical protein
MAVEPRSKELPLGVQVGALAALWVTWLGFLGWVLWKAAQHAKRGREFADPPAVYVPLLGGIPMVLVAAGLLFCYRMGAAARASRGYRILYYVIFALNVLGTVVALMGVTVGSQQIRE